MLGSSKLQWYDVVFNRNKPVTPETGKDREDTDVRLARDRSSKDLKATADTLNRLSVKVGYA